VSVSTNGMTWEEILAEHDVEVSRLDETIDKLREQLDAARALNEELGRFITVTYDTSRHHFRLEIILDGLMVAQARHVGTMIDHTALKARDHLRAAILPKPRGTP
jgi:hypothetical protein